MEGQALATLRGELLAICTSTAFLIIGLTSCVIAALRRRSGVRILLWLGIWSTAYGLEHLIDVRSVQLALPAGLRFAVPYVSIAVLYLALVLAACAWFELSAGTMRRIVAGLAVASVLTAAMGIGWFVATGVNSSLLMRVNNLLAAVFLLVLLVTTANRKLFDRYFLLPSRGFLLFGTLAFSAEALCVTTLRLIFNFRPPLVFDHIGFLVLLIAFGYSGLQMMLTNEQRLLEIQTELEVARQIQMSILPTTVPHTRDLRVSSIYRPMASVAGDFYEFLGVDPDHTGIFLADVCGHGIPAALIASMLKVAVQSAAACFDRPDDFLRSLNRTLAEPLRGQLVSAAYLWLDMQTRRARYSAAGHPPLLRCNQRIERIESNGLLFGISPESEYPLHEFPLCRGDRLLLYTDGVTEAENAAGQAFGDAELGRVVVQDRAETPDELSRRILARLREWQGSAEPQDDITLIAIGVE